MSENPTDVPKAAPSIISSEIGRWFKGAVR